MFGRDTSFAIECEDDLENGSTLTNVHAPIHNGQLTEILVMED
jgi:hypothetical protein